MTRRAFRCKRAQVFRRAKTARHDERIKLSGIGLCQRVNIAAHNTRRFNQHVTAFRHWLAGKMINHVCLRFIRSEADNVGPLAR